MPGDCGRSADAGIDGFGIDPWAALQRGGAGAVDDHEARADARDVDARNRAAVGGLALEGARQIGDALALLVDALKRLAHRRGRRRAFGMPQRAAQVVLADRGVEGGYGLLPDECEDAVEHRQ